MLIDSFPLSNGLGFLALGGYILTLLPTNLRIIFPQTKQTSMPKWLLKNRRLIGILSFLLALGHGYLLVKKRDFDFFDPSTFLVYVQGVSTFIIFALLAITSNDWSVKRLKKNWKRLHSLTYLAMFLLTWHVWDKMADHWSYLTPLGLATIVTFNFLYLYRRQLEHRHQQKAAQKKVVQLSVREKVAA
jgi:methionine sulfoxide reductase heme-binding subunit